MAKKGQVLAIDLLVAMSVFAFLLVLVFWLWHHAFQQEHLREQDSDIELVARRTTDSLFFTSGQPSNWHTISDNSISESTITSIGLKSGPLLDVEKLNKLNVMKSSSYNTVVRIAGIRGVGYSMNVQAYVYNDSIEGYNPTPTYRVGNQTPSADKIISKEYFGMGTDSQLYKVRVMIYYSRI